MAQYDVFPNPSGAGFLLDVQADLLDGLNTRVVVPLLPMQQAPHPAQRLNPVFVIDGQPVVMTTQFIAAVPRGLLHGAVGDLRGRFAEITNALDMLTHGF